ncbi:unnamed protein product [Medioppia subpectinata]|uniref:GTP 3',8-cyclase n=1 Tax=Medioppia subpectinata TaxID=1979941 RepID=A0A7R9KU99_9ACAR|nr:unnamed protein product [Medioppia subpectinata]CAG2109957.1 unnamed protein product [Medioppia subpectinata]
MFGRKHNYLRISLTERCNLRCLYCMPEEGIELTANRQLLTTDEIKRISDLFVKTLGVNKIRLTGGEPLIRKDIVDIVTHLSSLRPYGLKTIGLTTNGLILERMCRDLKSSGLTAINISLDTLDATKYEIITRRKGWHRVMRAIDTCLSAGFDSIKLNCVVIKGFNDTELPAFVDLTRDRPLDVRFIEYMPFDGNRWASEKMVTYREMLAAVSDKHPTVRRLEPSLNETAKAYKVDGFRGQIGFITSMSDNFCGACNRVRITADGNLKVCLFGNEEVSLRDAMRLDAADDTQLETVVRDALNRKHKQHAGAQNIANTPNRPMIRIGG